MKRVLMVLMLTCGLARLVMAGAATQIKKPDNPLAMFVGKWVVVESMMGRESVGSGVATATWGPAKNSVIIEYTSIDGPMKGFNLTEIISREKPIGKYSLVWVDSFNKGLGLKVGTLSKGGVFQFQNSGLEGEVRSLSYTLISGGEEGFTISTYKEKPNEVSVPTMKLVFHRQSED
ncbi:hypothetical protein [uncultured Pseudoteredinibacter sp.]|uniref:hypothetical protein n=1 Tax=uncultured Pseudoteredinibacter sp. TaxID=1641701 RepID=UPI002623B20E|nr:hypothetical protein [uncultured Pseudoteredinibacter sp.]